MQGLPLDGTSVWVTALYAVVLFLMGLCIAAAAPACNNPIFAEIVPPELRNMVSLVALTAPRISIDGDQAQYRQNCLLYGSGKPCMERVLKVSSASGDTLSCQGTGDLNGLPCRGMLITLGSQADADRGQSGGKRLAMPM